MTICCSNQTTPYCPRCGTYLKGSGLLALRAHLAKNAKRYKAELVKHGKMWRAPSHKWSSWLKALDEVIEQAKRAPDDTPSDESNAPPSAE